MNTICQLKDIYKLLYTFEKDFSEKNKLTINEAMVLCCLKSGDSLCANSLCEFVGLSNSRVSKVITSVEEKGYIQRELGKEDKRQMFFSLTPKGQEKTAMMQEYEKDLKQLLKEISTLSQSY